ncbi:hypothetical protein R3Q06_11170 [Rhodococcus erythropolis]|uniref:hypothetical protein n=1 Tax=Rhodococcus erythropolis TaxID=1833 RepID=UPI002948F862|nr:hypothetical protein [Rhodococcus erythropolis]MDV6274060.1 hypothetical protein [Rhodococcus erythropolis]
MSLRRTPLQRTPMKRTRSKNQPTRKRQRDTGFPESVKKLIHERSGRRCEVRQACHGDAAVQIHHRRPRGAGGSSVAWVNQAANGLDVCVRCHTFIESAREFSEAHGWLVSMNKKLRPDEVPVLLAHDAVPVLLSDDGTIHRPTKGD